MAAPQTSLPSLPVPSGTVLFPQTLAPGKRYILVTPPAGGNAALKYRGGSHPYTYQLALGPGQAAELDGDIIESVANLGPYSLWLYQGIRITGLNRAQNGGNLGVVLTDGNGATLPNVTPTNGNQMGSIPASGMLKGWVVATAAGAVALFLSIGTFVSSQVSLGTATAAGQVMPIPYPGIPVTRGAVLNYVNCGGTYLGIFED